MNQMNSTTGRSTRQSETVQRALEQVAVLYERMDRAYDQAAGEFGFICRGCPDNCCRTRFYHHTLAEVLYLKSGLMNLDAQVRKQALQRAEHAVQKMDIADKTARQSTIMCPLNENDRCILYAYRPMICRLHGIPHQLRRPDGQRQTGPGCADFDHRCGGIAAEPLDRTPLYIGLAGLEKQLRRQLGFQTKVKMTIAQILIDHEIL